MKFLNKNVLSFAGLVFIIYLVFWAPVINVLPGVTTGDMGKDFYAFQMTFQNKWPCRDYWWPYGPLMPFYYASWFVVGGVNLISVRIGLGVMYFLSSLGVYRTLRLFTSPSIAFLSSLAFLNFDMTWTFNHIGAIPFLLLSIFFLWRFFLTQRVTWCYLALFSLVVIALIKINIGLTSFLAFYVSFLCFVGWIQWKSRKSFFHGKHLFLIPLTFGGLTFVIYGFLYSGLPLHQVNQCLMNQIEYQGVVTPWVNFEQLILRFLVWEPSRLLTVGFFLVLAVLARLSLKKKGLSMKEKAVYPFVTLSLFLFGSFNSIEYLILEGYIYRFDFWIFPIGVLLMGLLAERVSHLLGRRLKVFLSALVILIFLWSPTRNLKQAFAFKVPEHYLDFPAGQVYLRGSSSDVKVIRDVTRFIIENTEPTQEILVIPYDVFYCFLSWRRHAVRETLFLKYINIRESQEEEIIQKIEAKQVPLVLISNRDHAGEIGDGHFGKTHCRKLARYIFDHYREIRTFGPWEGQRSAHAIKVLQRI